MTIGTAKLVRSYTLMIHLPNHALNLTLDSVLLALPLQSAIYQGSG